MHVEPIRRVMVRIPVTFRTPASISSGRPSLFVDDEVVCDGSGCPIVPGSALAGAVTARLRGVAEAHLLDNDWGADDKQSRASRISIADAVVAATSRVVRNGVGIDRATGSARSGLLFEREVLAAGAEFDVSITADDPDDETLRSVGLACVALSEANIRLGGRTTTGLGAIEASLDDAVARVVVLDTPQAIADEVLRRLDDRNGDWAPLADVVPLAGIAGLHWAPKTVRIHVPWKPLRHVLVAAASGSATSDALPIAELQDGRVVLPLPGTSLKGVLRSHAERLMRTILDCDMPFEELGDRPLHEQVDVPVVSHLFGTSGHTASDDRSSDRNRRGAIIVDEAVSAWSCTVEQWRAVLDAETDAQLHSALEVAGLDHGTIEYHIAIDRWLGGVADHRLFDNLALHGVEWQPIEMSVDMGCLEDEADVALLIHVLQWAAGGWTPLGSRSRAGVGDFDLTDDIVVTWPEGDTVRIKPNGELDGSIDLLHRLRTSWGERLDRLQREQTRNEVVQT